jgi:hypothetical protein
VVVYVSTWQGTFLLQVEKVSVQAQVQGQVEVRRVKQQLVI